jgi:2-polyprenyl-3-methyl-5-hydroxy-6-metoxy-1,4-benzoquinol methylase
MRSVETLHLGRTGINNFSSIDIPVLEEFCVGKRVLDIGCANGDVVKYLRQKNTEAYGVDGDINAIEIFSDPSIRDFLMCHDYTKGESNITKTIDVVISTDFCEHVEEKYIDNYMKDFLLGDIIILHTPPKGTPGHHHVNTQNSEYWILLFAQHGAKFDKRLTEQVRTVSEYYNPVDMAYFEKHPHILPKHNYLVFKNK